MNTVVICSRRERPDIEHWKERIAHRGYGGRALLFVEKKPLRLPWTYSVPAKNPRHRLGPTLELLAYLYQGFGWIAKNP